jgi:hypothetical protein
VKRALAALSVLLLASCAAPAPQVITKLQIETPTVPAQLLTCSPAPAVPPSAGLTQSAVAVYVAQLWDAHLDCSDKLAAVKQALSTLITPTAH